MWIMAVVVRASGMPLCLYPWVIGNPSAKGVRRV